MLFCLCVIFCHIFLFLSSYPCLCYTHTHTYIYIYTYVEGSVNQYTLSTSIVYYFFTSFFLSVYPSFIFLSSLLCYLQSLSRFDAILPELMTLGSFSDLCPSSKLSKIIIPPFSFPIFFYSHLANYQPSPTLPLEPPIFLGLRNLSEFFQLNFQVAPL